MQYLLAVRYMHTPVYISDLLTSVTDVISRSQVGVLSNRLDESRWDISDFTWHRPT